MHKRHLLSAKNPMGLLGIPRKKREGSPLSICAIMGKKEYSIKAMPVKAKQMVTRLSRVHSGGSPVHGVSHVPSCRPVLTDHPTPALERGRVTHLFAL